MHILRQDADDQIDALYAANDKDVRHIYGHIYETNYREVTKCSSPNEELP